jgi:hypothetical protein
MEISLVEVLKSCGKDLLDAKCDVRVNAVTEQELNVLCNVGIIDNGLLFNNLFLGVCLKVTDALCLKCALCLESCISLSSSSVVLKRSSNPSSCH